jgi:hypothetical protein
MKPRMTFNSESSYLSLPSAEITDGYHHIQTNLHLILGKLHFLNPGILRGVAYYSRKTHPKQTQF